MDERAPLRGAPRAAMSGDDAPRRPSAAEAVRKRARGLLGLIVDPLVAVLARLGVSPNMVSVGGFAVTAVAAWPLAEGSFLLGGLLLLGGSATDMLDGALARATGKVSKRGGLLDSTLDRVSEAAVLFGLLYYFVEDGATEEACSSSSPSPRRCSSATSRPGPKGWASSATSASSPGRSASSCSAPGLIAGQVTIFLYITAVASFITAAHRFLHAWRQAGTQP